MGEGESRGGLLAEQNEYRKGSVEAWKWMKKKILCSPTYMSLNVFSLKMSEDSNFSFFFKVKDT